MSAADLQGQLPGRLANLNLRDGVEESISTPSTAGRKGDSAPWCVSLIPLEVWGKIFEFVFESLPSCDDTYLTEAQRSMPSGYSLVRLRLSLVCRLFRRVIDVTSPGIFVYLSTRYGMTSFQRFNRLLNKRRKVYIKQLTINHHLPLSYDHRRWICEGLDPSDLARCDLEFPEYRATSAELWCWLDRFQSYEPRIDKIVWQGKLPGAVKPRLKQRYRPWTGIFDCASSVCLQDTTWKTRSQRILEPLPTPGKATHVSCVRELAEDYYGSYESEVQWMRNHPSLMFKNIVSLHVRYRRLLPTQLHRLDLDNLTQLSLEIYHVEAWYEPQVVTAFQSLGPRLKLLTLRNSKDREMVGCPMHSQLTQLIRTVIGHCSQLEFLSLQSHYASPFLLQSLPVFLKALHLDLGPQCEIANCLHSEWYRLCESNLLSFQKTKDLERLDINCLCNSHEMEQVIASHLKSLPIRQVTFCTSW